MDEPIENLYFNWLCSKVVQLKRTTPSLTHWNLLRHLHHTEYVWLISGDDNRAEDGVFLREEFQTETGNTDESWEHIPCSMLEMLVAFSKRLELATEESRRTWFWEMLRNLRLTDFTDAEHFYPAYVDEILHTLNWRTYDYFGEGGLFPIKESSHDQTKVELWYQFCDYLVDQDRLP